MKNNSGNVAVANATSLDEIKTYTTETKRALRFGMYCLAPFCDKDGSDHSSILAAMASSRRDSANAGNVPGPVVGSDFRDCCSAPQPIGQFINS